MCMQRAARESIQATRARARTHTHSTPPPPPTTHTHTWGVAELVLACGGEADEIVESSESWVQVVRVCVCGCGCMCVCGCVGV